MLSKEKAREKSREYQYQRYWADRKGELLRCKRKRDALKIKVFTHYSQGTPKCLHCGENDLRVLCIDHENGGGAEERRKIKSRGGCQFYRWLKRNGYPSGYQVLCANCNLRKEYKDKKDKIE